MFPIQDQISVATKTSLDTQLAAFSTLSGKMFESLEKLVSLNLTAAKATLDESTAKVHEMLAAKNPQELIAMAATQTQPNIEKCMAYGRNLTTIASGTQAELVQVGESQLAEVNRSFTKMVSDVSKSAPGGSEGVIDLMKTAMDSANKGFEQMTRTSKQAAQAVEANLNSTMSQIIKPH